MQKIEEAAEKGELTELVLLVIWNRLDLARCDVCFFQIPLILIYLFILEGAEFNVLTYNWLFLQDEKDAVRSLDLLYRRVEV